MQTLLKMYELMYYSSENQMNKRKNIPCTLCSVSYSIEHENRVHCKADTMQNYNVTYRGMVRARQIGELG